MTTLEDLYYGNISPHERYIKRGTRVDKLVKLICKNEEELNASRSVIQDNSLVQSLNFSKVSFCFSVSPEFNYSSFLHISLTSLSTLDPRLMYLS